MKNLNHPFRGASVLVASLLLSVVLGPVAAPAQTANANPPGQISYQGFLTDANGGPLATNAPVNYNVTFRIYNSPNTSTPIWGELQTVTVDHGYFSVLLGQGSAVSGVPNTNNLTSIFTGADASARYIGITVAGLAGVTAEIQPRLQLLSSPYALLAANANALVTSTGSQILTTSGNSVGINQTPLASDALDITGNLGISGTTNTLVFGRGLTGQEPNAGTIGYETYSKNALDIVGAGTNVASRRIKFWAEGGASTTGPLGVGIDTPAATLDVNGGAFFATGALPSSSGSRPGISIFWDATHNVGQIQSLLPPNGRSLVLNAGGGNVGVNNLAPNFTLDVGGTINSSSGLFTGGKVSATGGVVAGNGVLSEGALSIAGMTHLNNNVIQLRDGIDHNHWLGYGTNMGPFNVASLGNFNNGVTPADGPALVGFSGGVLGTTGSTPGGGTNYALYWNAVGQIFVRSGAYATGFYNNSDRNLKEKFEELDPKGVLAKVAAMPITEWNFTNSPAERHIGPMAQDFQAAFHLSGGDDKHIGMSDESGVALAAIKGLNEVVREKDAQIKDLDRQVKELRAMVESLARSKSAGDR